MGLIKQIDIKNRTYFKLFLQWYYWSQRFSCKIEKSYKGIGIYNIGYITKKKMYDYESINSVNPLYFCINHASRYIEEINENKYLISDSID